MARKQIDIGVVGNDGTGDSIRDSFRKVNDNFRELYSSLGLGERLTFMALDDAPPGDYTGRNDATTGLTPLVTINNTATGLAFKSLKGGTGINIDYSTNGNEIIVNSGFSEISADESPSLGGSLNAFYGGGRHAIGNLPDLRSSTEIINAIDELASDHNEAASTQTRLAVNKGYADGKVSLAGATAIDPATGLANSAFGRMTGPLILARDPDPDDDINYDGLVAATKRYVDNSAFGSITNLYVATSGQDERVGVSKSLQGRALAYAYRTIEAALRRAEELVLESRQEIGPYKKVLTYNNGASTCTLSSIDTSPVSGSGFAGQIRLSVDTVTINNIGTNYFVGDILTISGGSIPGGGGAATIEVLTTLTTPGAILTYRIVSTGVYSTLPGSTAVGTTISRSAAPAGISAIGSGASFDITYKVNSVGIASNGSGYSLVSVRITGGGGAGAFGTAVVSGGAVTSVTITDQGSGFTSLPTLEVDLPRFAIYTANRRTDFTGDVVTDTPEAYKGRDIREGLFLHGEESGALAQILGHSGALDSLGNELFDVDIKYGAFKLNEPIAYGDVTKNIQITVLVESGIYEENYPLKVPQNVSIVGDEFRRCIIRPRQGTSSSPWAFQKFRRDLTVGSPATTTSTYDIENDVWVVTTTEGDELTIATQIFGHHYLQDSSQPVYPKISNEGARPAAAALLQLNRIFMQEEVGGWINNQITNGTTPFTTSFEYDEKLCKRDVGLIVDAISFDLKWGGYNRTISAGLKYYQSASSRIAITTQLSQTLAAINYLNVLIQKVIDNTTVTTTYQTLYPQVIDRAYASEVGADTVIDELINAIKDVMDGSGSVNYPKENNQMDVFLGNDAVRWQGISCQGHGGFMLVLDPEGQILAKSPYAQECASFSQSINRQTFAGGMFVDGFSGNLQITMTSAVTTTRIGVTNLERIPNLPCSFIVNDAVYRVNYVRDFVYNKDGSSATLILDETTPWTFGIFTYDSAICSRDTGYILDGLGYDIVFGTNYNGRKASLTYRQANAREVVDNQLSITVRAIAYAHERASSFLDAYPNIQNVVDQSSDDITSVVQRGASYAPTLVFTDPPGVDVNLSRAKTLLLANIQYIKDEVIGYLDFTYPSLDYSSSTCARDVGYIIEAVIYDILYGGNEMTRDAGLKYYDGVGNDTTRQIPADQLSETVAGINHAKYLAKQVIVDDDPITAYSSTVRTAGTASNTTTQDLIETLMSNIATTLSGGVGSAPTLTPASVSAYNYDADDIAARTIIGTNKATIQSDVIDFVDVNGNLYELLMPGNRSMLSNDFTQINDLGYGIFATNGGLVEAVSMFTYYCHISYYSLNGAQIRSVGGSSAHGNYALVAQGSDPLEVPTPTTLYNELSQGAEVYFPDDGFANVIKGLVIFVTNYSQIPLNNSELEIDHGYEIYRYPVTSVAVGNGLPDGVARLNLTSDQTGNFEGLYKQVPDGTPVTIRSNSQIILTGDLALVATRPSTGLVLAESPDVYRVLQFENHVDENGPYAVTITTSNPATFGRSAHRLLAGYTLEFVPTDAVFLGTISGTTLTVTSLTSGTITAGMVLRGSGITSGTTIVSGAGSTWTISNSHTIGTDTAFTCTGTLPVPLQLGKTYYVSSDGLDTNSFRVSDTRFGQPIATTAAGIGTYGYIPTGLTRTTMRENYNYVDLTLTSAGEYVDTAPTGNICTLSIADPMVVSRTGHGLAVGDVIKFTTSGELPTGVSLLRNYHIIADGFTADSFQVSVKPDGDPIVSTLTQSGVHRVGLVTGRVGDDTFAVVGVGPQDVIRVPKSKFVFKGVEYTVEEYQSLTQTNQSYARIVISPPLQDSMIAYESSYTIKAGVPIRSVGAEGSLTIRISLTRVTSHDLLDIGTGSYADTNYPNEIYGPAVNVLNDTNETEERTVGRTFYVTTDQYGNFNVGPYFRVDQGTGRVTFSAAIALSNLDGLGFKRGVPIAEFSTDSGFSDNATDTVPTENAARIYIERRLGVGHGGATVIPTQLIPPTIGGYMALSGQLPMKGDMDLNDHKIVKVTDCTDPQDAVNLRSLTFNNFQDITVTNPKASDLLVFTGAQDDAVNATVVGDVTFNIRAGTDSSLNQIDVQINADTIINADVKSDAEIAQSKLAMTLASARESAPTGTAQVKQAASGLASFDTDQFTVTDGFVTVKENGLVISTIAQIPSKTVLGNSTLSAGNVSEVAMTSVVDLGLGIKKAQYSSTGLLRRTNASTNSADGDYVMIEAAAGSSISIEASKLIARDVSGNFGGNILDVKQVKVDNNVSIDTTETPTGGYIQYYGWNLGGGVLVGNGTLAADKNTNYWNDAHYFKTQNGVSFAPIQASSVQCLTLTTGGNKTLGQITGRWSLTGDPSNDTDSRLEATYAADLAEYYEGDAEYEVGTVLVFGGDKEVTLTNKEGDPRVAGVVSNTAGFVMYGACPGLKNLVALQGRVPCKVVGKIKKGEMLVTSKIAGVAVAAGDNVRVGTVVGKALQDYDSDHIGTIEVAVGRT